MAGAQKLRRAERRRRTISKTIQVKKKGQGSRLALS
jgi:hypothetical protein